MIKTFWRAQFLVLLVAALLAGCNSKSKQTEWGIFQEPIKAQPLPLASGEKSLSINWRRNIGAAGKNGYAILKPAVVEGGVVVTNRAGTVQYLDLESGKVVWRSELEKAVFAGVGAGAGLALVSHDSAEVVALDLFTGDEKWRVEIGRPVSAIPVAGAGRVVVRTGDGLLIGLDATDGALIWTVERTTPALTLHGDSSPFIAGETVIAGMSNGKLMVNSVINGRDYWETDLSFVRGSNQLERLSDVDTPPVVVGSNLYAANYQGDVVAVDLNSSAVAWRNKVSTRLPLSIQSGRLFVTSALGKVVALNVSTGETEWTQVGFQGRGVSNPLGVDDKVVIGDANGNIHVLSANDGALLESRKVSSGAVTSLIATANGFVAFSVKGAVVAATFTP